MNGTVKGNNVNTETKLKRANGIDQFPLRLTSLISLLSNGLSKVFCSATTEKHQLFGAQPSLWSNSNPYMTTRKTIALNTVIYVSKVMSVFYYTV